MGGVTTRLEFASLDLIQTTHEICGKCKFWRPSIHHTNCFFIEIDSGPKFPEVGHCRRNPPVLGPVVDLDEDRQGEGPALQTLIDGSGDLFDIEGFGVASHAIGMWPLTAITDWCGEFKERSR
jgi:hypothetical protein